MAAAGAADGGGALVLASPPRGAELEGLPRVQDPETRYKRVGEGCAGGAIGEGSFGKVYVAKDTLTGTVVAVKRQSEERPEAWRELLLNRALRPSAHPNIVRILDSFVATDTRSRNHLYTVFDYMDSSLASLLRHRRGTFAGREVQCLWESMAAGVAHLHRFGVVHGDVSHGNVLVRGAFDATGRIDCRIADLGCAFDASSFVLPLHQYFTTLSVRAPEVVLGAGKVAEPIDVWALGIHMLCLATRSYVYSPVRPSPGAEGATLVGTAEADARDNNGLFRDMLFLLGWPTEASWPNHRGLPRYSAIASSAEVACAPVHSSGALSDLRRLDDRIFRPMGYESQPLTPADAETVDLVRWMLRWDPARRPSAERVLAALASAPRGQGRGRGRGKARAGPPVEQDGRPGDLERRLDEEPAGRPVPAEPPKRAAPTRQTKQPSGPTRLELARPPRVAEPEAPLVEQAKEESPAKRARGPVAGSLPPPEPSARLRAPDAGPPPAPARGPVKGSSPAPRAVARPRAPEAGRPPAPARSPVAGSSPAPKAAARPRVPEAGPPPAPDSVTQCYPVLPSVAGPPPPPSGTPAQRRDGRELGTPRGQTARTGGRALRKVNSEDPCPGNCGSFICMALRNRRIASKKQGGLSPESPAAQGLCLCEIAGCNTPRNKYTHGAGRWCRFHGVTGDLSRDDAGSYTNRNGRHDYGPRWGAPVKFSARFGFVLEHLEPLDNVVARAMVRAWLASAVPGRWVEATVLVEMFLGHSIKWVKEVGRWQELVDASHLRLAGVSTAETLVEAYRNVILWSDGRAWPKMFHRMNHGRAHATTGLAVSAGQLGLLGKGASGETGQIVRLGPAQTAYLLKADTSIAIKLVEALLVLAKDAVRWPARHIEEDLQLFAGQLLKFASDARSLRMGKAGFTGGTSPVAYHVRLDPESKHVLNIYNIIYYYILCYYIALYYVILYYIILLYPI